jgi:hypothetical protein
MPIYTVHEPAPKGGAPDPGRVAFVRDGFHFWAFLLGPVWMIWRGLWLVTLLYAVFWLALGVMLSALRVPAAASFAIWVLVALLVGFEASTLCRWTLRRRGWKETAAVVGDDLESAERRFFSAWIGRAGAEPRPATPPSAPPSAPLRMPRSSTPDVVGLFPEPGGQR